MSKTPNKLIAVKPERYNQLFNLAVSKADTFDSIIQRLIESHYAVRSTANINKKEESLPASVGPLSETATVAATREGSATT